MELRGFDQQETLKPFYRDFYKTRKLKKVKRLAFLLEKSIFLKKCAFVSHKISNFAGRNCNLDTIIKN